MAQNISSFLQMAPQQYGNQGTAAPTQAGTVGVGGGGSSSMETLEGMMAMGGAAQKLAQQRNLENQRGLERLFAEAGVGPQGLLNTLGIGLGNALGQRSAGKNPDGEMQRANAIDSLMGQARSTSDPVQLLEIGRQLIALREYSAGGDIISLSNNYRSIDKSEAVEQQRKQKEEQRKANIGKAPEVIEIKAKDGNVVSLEMRTWNDDGVEKRTGMRPGDMELLMSSLGQNEQTPGKLNKDDPALVPTDNTDKLAVIDMFKKLPVGSRVPVEGETYVITKDGPVMQEKPTTGRGARGRRSRAQRGK